MGIIELMEKYSLTLRKLPESVRYCIAYNDRNLSFVNRAQKDYRIEEHVVKSDCTQEQFEKNYPKEYHKHKRLSNGYVIDKFITYSEPSNGGWACLIDKSNNSTQHYENECFRANTPEKAILLAVEYIEKQKKSLKEKYEAAGLIFNDKKNGNKNAFQY